MIVIDLKLFGTSVYFIHKIKLFRSCLGYKSIELTTLLWLWLLLPISPNNIFLPPQFIKVWQKWLEQSCVHGIRIVSNIHAVCSKHCSWFPWIILYPKQQALEFNVLIANLMIWEVSNIQGCFGWRTEWFGGKSANGIKLKIKSVTAESGLKDMKKVGLWLMRICEAATTEPQPGLKQWQPFSFGGSNFCITMQSKILKADTCYE